MASNLTLQAGFTQTYRLLSQKDGNGSTKVSYYDKFGQVGQVVNPLGPGTVYAYDTLGQMTSATYGSATTTLSYVWGRKTAMNDADMGAWSYGYDAIGNLTRQTDSSSQTTCLYYDYLNRPVGKTFQTNTACPVNPGYGGYSIKYYYDEPAAGSYPIGQRTRMVDNSGTTTWLYDTRGRKTQEDRTISGNLYTTKYSYTSADQVKTMTYPSRQVITMGYNNQGALNAVNNGTNTTYLFNQLYDSAGRTTSLQMGKTGSAATLTQNYSYYPWLTPTTGGRLNSIVTINSQVKSLQNLTYSEYDSNGNLIAASDQVYWNGTLYTDVSSFGYDALNRLTGRTVKRSGTSIYSEAFEYDGEGRMSKKTVNGSASTMAYNDPSHPHAVTAYNGVSYAYGLRGNLLSRGLMSFGYDSENRLQTVGGSVSAQYTYDGDGMLIKTDDILDATHRNITVTIGGYYEKYIPTTGTAVVREYIFANGQRIAVSEGASETTSGTVTYLLNDRLGSLNVTVNASGNWQSSLRYTAFGEERANGSSGTTTDPYRYTGQLSKMATVGLYFYQSRWMDPVTGHFAQPDSIVPDPYSPQDWDRFAYVQNDPINFDDPSGHAQQTPDDLGTWWEQITPTWIEQNIEDSQEQDEMLMHYMVEHPNYSAYKDQQLISAGYDLTASDARYSIYKFLGEAYKISIFTTLSKNPLKYVLDLLKGTGPVLGAGFVLGGGPGDYLLQLNERMGVKFPANNMRSQGAFVKYTDQFYKRMQKDTTLILTIDEADALVTLSRTYGIEPRLDTGHLDDTWNMPHLHFGEGQANPHVRVPNGYSLP